MSKKIEEIKQMLASGDEQKIIGALLQTFNCGQEGFEIFIKYSQQEKPNKVKQILYWIWRKHNAYFKDGFKQKISDKPTDTITCLAINEKHKLLVGGSWKKIYAWYLETGKLFHIFSHGHSDWVLSVAVSSDGNTLVTGSADKSIIVWNLKDKKLIHTLSSHVSWVTAVSISPDRKKIISGSLDKSIKIWNLETGKLIKTLKNDNETAPILTVAISPDGKNLASGDTNNKIKLWNLESGKLIHTLDGHSDWVTALVITSDNKRLISGSRDGDIKMWEANPNLVHKYFGQSLKLNFIKALIDFIATIILLSGFVRIGISIVFIKFFLRGKHYIFPGNNLENKVIRKLDTIDSLNYNENQNIITLACNEVAQVFSLESDKVSYTLLSEKCGFTNAVVTNLAGSSIVSAGSDWLMRYDLKGRPIQSFEGCSYSKLSKIYIYKSSDKLFCGESRSLKVVGRDQNNKEIKVNDEKIEWITDGGSIHQSIFTAGNREGTFNIKARVGIFEADTTIKIIDPPRASKLSISHYKIKLEFGQVQKIIGVVLDQQYNPMLHATIKWEVKGGGRIKGDGYFQAGHEAGEFEIHASHGSLRKIISVNVIEPPKLQEIEIISLVNKLEYNQKIQLHAKGIDQYGNEIKISNVTWSASSGKIDEYGFFNASNQEKIVVIEATSGKISAYIEFEVRETSHLVELKISPTDINLIPGEEAIFSVTALNQYGEEISSEGINWTTTGGIVSQSGYFRAEYNQKGCYEVTATLDNYSATATVHIPSILKRIEISPNEIELKPEEENLFIFTGFDQTDTVIPLESVYWQTTAGGSITQNGLFKGNYKHNEVTITASVKNINATAKVILLPVLRRLEIIPGFVYLKPGEQQLFTVKSFDQFNQEIESGEIYWKTTGAKIEQNGMLTVSSSDQDYIQVTATSKLVPKYSQDVKNLFLYTGIFSRIMYWLISNEGLLENLLSSDIGQEEFDYNANLDVETDTNQDTEEPEHDANKDISFDINLEVDNRIETEESVEIDNNTLVEAKDDIDILDFYTALEEWIFRQVLKKASHIFLSISNFCLDEASANLSASANVFVLATKYNPYKYFECLNTLSHQGSFSSLAITPDGQQMISGSWDNTIKIWDIKTGKLIKILESHESNVKCISITPDGHQIISVDWDNTIKVWDLDTGNLIESLPRPSIVKFTVISSNAQKLISSEYSTIEDYTNIQIWDFDDLKLGKTLPTKLLTIQPYFLWHKCIVISPDSKKIIVATQIIKVYDLESGKLLTIIGKSLGWVYALAMTKDSKKLISSYDKKIIIWDLTTKNLGILRTLKSDVDRVYHNIVVTPDGQRLVSASSRIYDTDDTGELVDCTSFIEIWDLNTGEKLHSIKNYDKAIDYLAITPDGTKIISAHRYESIKIWGIPNFNE